MDWDGFQSVLGAPGEGKARLLLEARLPQLLLDVSRILIFLSKLQALLDLLLLLPHEGIVGLRYVVVNSCIVCHLGEVEDVVGELLVLKVGYFGLDAGPQY